jgi:4-amino-4-deoxychorismate lyase
MLLETIRCEHKEAKYLSYHQKRLEQACQTLGITKQYDLRTLITPPDEKLYRCRFLYDTQGYSIEFHPYSPKKIGSLKLITCDSLEYPLKYADREALNLLFELRGVCDDVLIVKNGCLSDTTIANVALKIEEVWFTPDNPLLKGTTRARLIDEGFLTPSPLKPSDIAKATKIAIMNAMVGFIEVENGIIY